MHTESLSHLLTLRWGIGLVVSLALGHVAANLAMGKPSRERFVRSLPIGLTERFFFTLGVAFTLDGIGIAMIAWSR